jgi:hypothetical protein
MVGVGVGVTIGVGDGVAPALEQAAVIKAMAATATRRTSLAFDARRRVAPPSGRGVIGAAPEFGMR